MKFNCAFLCDQATTRGTVIDISGGFREWVEVRAFPGEHLFTVAAVAELDRVEMGIHLGLSIDIIQDQGDGLLGHSDITVERPSFSGYDPAAPLYAPFSVDLSVTFAAPGSHRVVIRHRNDEAAVVRFGVRSALPI